MTNNMKIQRVLLFLLLVVLVTYQACCSASPLTNVARPRLQVKRSLCNTFGGCGAKRSLQQQAANWQTNGFEAVGGSSSEKNSQIQARRESSAELVAEVLGDLMEYLQTNEKYRQGKYVLVVPKSYDTLLGSATNGIETSRAGPIDTQELQVGKFYLDKNE